MRILGYASVSTLALAGLLAFSSPAQSQWSFWDGVQPQYGHKNNLRKAKLPKRPQPDLENIVQSRQAIPKSDILFTSTNDFNPGIPSDIRATFHLTKEDLYPATHGKANAKLFSEYLSMLNSKIPQSNQALAPTRNRLLRQAELYFGLGKSIQAKILQSTGTLIFGDRLMQLVDKYRPMLESGRSADVEYQIPRHLIDAPVEISLKVSLSERKVRLYANGHLEMTAPVAIGKSYWRTGDFFLARCSENPIWYGLTPSDARNLPKPGWNNPYGKAMCELATGATTSFAVSFKEDIANVRDERGRPVYGMIRVHHTDNPLSVGKMASHGCLRNDYAVMGTIMQAAGHYHGSLGTKNLGRGATTVYTRPIPISIFGNPTLAKQ